MWLIIKFKHYRIMLHDKNGPQLNGLAPISEKLLSEQRLMK